MNSIAEETINSIKHQYETLSLDELELHTSVLNDIHQQKIESESKRIKNELLEAAKKFKISLHVEEGIEIKKIYKPLIKKSKLMPKYKNPNNSEETWNGYGRKPNWLCHYLTLENTSIDDLLI
ncbi:MAG: H-NS histone family protein [Methylococcaceae bacterium]|nr:MAG: H-NS histone family protein [Methylococcaceae bacterium]